MQTRDIDEKANQQSPAETNNRLSSIIDDLEIDEQLKNIEDAFLACNENLEVNREQLKDIFETMGIPLASDGEFDEQWLNIDQDQDGIVSFADFKEFILTAKDDKESFASLCQADSVQLLTAENLSMLANLFEENKTRPKSNETNYFLDINKTLDKLNGSSIY